MKHKITIIIIAVTLIFVSCVKKESYELSDLSHHILDEWVAYYQSANNDFSLKRFKVLSSKDAFVRGNFHWENYDLSDNYVPAAIYSPDSNFYIDLDFYNEIEDGVYTGSDVNSRADLIDVRNKKSSVIFNCGSSCWQDDAYWVNDSVFVLLNVSEHIDPKKNIWTNDNYILYIEVRNIKGEILKKYRYDHEVNPPEDIYLRKRFEKHGIKVMDFDTVIHAN
jgi:hypothetical protein